MMLELSIGAGLEPAELEIKTVSGLAQVFELTLTDGSGSEADLSGVEFRGAVNTAPLTEFACQVQGGKVLFAWTRLPAGRHSFDLFMVTGGAEHALLRGVMVVAGRTTLPLDTEEYSVNHAASLVYPDEADGVIRVELSELGLMDLLSRRAGAFMAVAADHARSAEGFRDDAMSLVDDFTQAVAKAEQAIAEAREAALSDMQSSGNQIILDMGGVANDMSINLSTAEKNILKKLGESRQEAETSINELVHQAETASRDAVNLASGFTKTVGQAEQSINTAKDTAVRAVQTNQADAVRAVGGASQTAQQNISSAQSTAVETVATAQTGAVQAVGVASQTAQNNISSAKGAALESVSTAQKGAVLAVTNAQTAATGAITPLVQRAETAQAEVEMAEGRVMILETNAAQSSTDASEAATSAQQALAAIPTVDASGNMMLTGNLTTNGATVNGQLNANGGINIPVPPATDTDGVNRLYAAGLSAVVDAMRIPLYLSKTKSTLTQGAFSEPVPGQVLSAPVAAKSRQMLSIGLDYTMHAASNYSQGLGWVLPLRSTVYGQLKVSVSYGHGVYTAASSDDMDAYEIYPTDASKQAYGAAMDIYLDQTNIGGNRAAVRTRIIYYDLAVKMMMVRTVTAHVDINNTGLISATSAIVYQQHSDTSGGNPTSDYGSIWLIRNGLASKNIVKIADVPGIHCFSGAKLNSPVLINGKAEDIYANVINVGAPVMQLACGNGRNPAYYGFQALETNAVISSTTAPYEPPTNV